MLKYKFIEALRRLMQMVFGLQLFTFPGLYTLRTWAYRLHFSIGPKPRIGYNVILHREHGCRRGSLRIGADVLLSDNVKIDYSGRVVIEDHVWLSEGVHIHTHTHSLDAAERVVRHGAESVSELLIAEGAWLGDGVKVLPGVSRIGRGSVIGAGSVVTRDIPDDVVAAGNPAKILE